MNADFYNEVMGLFDWSEDDEVSQRIDELEDVLK